jgi:hypothetical protein
MMRHIWNFLSSVKLTIWIICLAIALLLTGSIYVPSNAMGFNTLNHMTIPDWCRQWGLQNLDKSWWFFALAAVLLLLGVNAGCCIVDRLQFHWCRRSVTGMRVFIFKATPSLIHACFGVMLLGHFASVCIGYRSRPMEFLSPEEGTAHYSLPGDIRMAVGKPECSFYSGPFAGTIRHCGISLIFEGSGRSVEKEVELGKPLFWNGFQIHMSQAGGQRNPEPFSTPAFQLLVKRDPGLPLIILCFPVLILLTLYYYIEERRIRFRFKVQGIDSEILSGG